MKHYINCMTEEVHEAKCPNMPALNKINLGRHKTAPEAVKAALSKGFTNANGCDGCCSSAHKK